MSDYQHYLASVSFASDFSAKHEKAFTALFETFYEEMFAFSHQITGNEADAEDVAVMAIVNLCLDPERFLRGASSSIGSENVKRYLGRVVKNESLNRLKENKRRHRRELAYAEMIGSEAGLEFAMAEAELMKTLLHLAITELPRQVQEVVKLTYFQGLKYQQVAQTLGISINTVKTHLKRGKDHLRFILSRTPSQTLWTIVFMGAAFRLLVYKYSLFF